VPDSIDGDYTDRYPEDQMENSLIEQSHFVPEFIRNSWQEIFNRAEASFQPWQGRLDQVYLCGCGDSHHAAIGLEFAFNQWSGCRVRAAPAMFMSRYLIPRSTFPSNKTLVIGISSSGEVARTIEAIELGNEIGAKTLAFTSNNESTLANIAASTVTFSVPSYPGPGLLSYISSLLMGYAVCAVLANDQDREEIFLCMEELPGLLEDWIPVSMDRGEKFAEDPQIDAGCLFVASGSLLGSAYFGAAKLIESAGIYAWAQELEEWAHLEYFCNPAKMPIWFLSAGGRSRTREEEVLQAATAIGRCVGRDQWGGSKQWRPGVREALAPLVLWTGATSCAVKIAERLNEEPFRGFKGGRSQMEGGGVSRIRSSFRYTSTRDFI
jgi:glucosamine--fructose-6-phosphate aminotransferase (isomerizing)